MQTRQKALAGWVRIFAPFFIITSVSLRARLMVFAGIFCFIQAAGQDIADTLAVAGKKGTMYPAFHLRNAEGEIYSSQMRGKVIWINFWFEACKPCMAEMGAIDEIARELRSRKDFVILSLTWEDIQAIQRVKSKFPMSYPIYSVTEETCERLNGGGGYPTNVVVDKSGMIRYIGVGGKTDPDQAREDIRQRILPIIKEALQ
jgi:thiol-disulfide isomerase/thioredoxin